MSKNYDQILSDINDRFYNWSKNKEYPTPTMSNKLYPYTNLFSPITVNRLKLKNRIVMAPMGNVSMCEETGKPNEQLIRYFEERAEGGVGLITTGLIPVSYREDPSLLEKGDLVYFPRIDRSRTVLAGWRDLTSAVHAHGSKIFIQLSAGLGRVGNPQCLMTKFKLPRSASFNPNFYIGQIPCLRLSDIAAKRIVKKIGQAAADAKHCNLDGIYLHGHEGYLIEQMTNSAFNRRKIGRYRNTQAFGIDMIRAIRKRCGNDYPIMYRIDLSLLLNMTYGEKMNSVKALKKFKNERTVSECLDFMKNLVAAGVDMFDVDLGCYDNWWLPHPPSSMPPKCYVEVAQIVKEYFKENGVKTCKGQEVTVVGVGKLGYPDDAEALLRSNACDMIMLGRPLLADSEWCNKAYRGDTGDIVPCIGCQEACINEFVEGGHPQCAVNPRCAFEYIYPKHPPAADIKKKVAVIGGGPAGMAAAHTLYERSHNVTLFEAKNTLGGMLIPGSAPKIKYELNNYLQYMISKTERLAKCEGFTLRLGAAADAETLKSSGYDAIVFACGSAQCKPPVEGINDKKVMQAIDVLNKPDLVKSARDIVVIGGGVVGVETAQFLSYQYGKKVTVVEMMPVIMNHTCTANRGHLLQCMELAGISLLNCTKLIKVTEDGVEVSRNVHPSVPDPYVRWNPILPDNVVNPLAKKIKENYVTEIIKADAVLLSAGVRPEDKLYYDCVHNNIAPEIYNVGDSLSPARVMEAVRAAYRKALTV